jgi:hypothetical protein
MNEPLGPDALARAQTLVLNLLAKGWSHQRIAEGMDDRVSPRTIYRWAKGEHAPQQAKDLVALERLVEKSVSA